MSKKNKQEKEYGVEIKSTEDAVIEAGAPSVEDAVIEPETVFPTSSFQKEAKIASKREAKSSLVELVRVANLRHDKVCIVEDADGNGYIVPLDTKFVTGKMKGDPNKMEKAYSWDEEIEAMLPDRETLIKNIRRSLWISGGFEKGAGRVPRRLDQAWPYRIVEE